MKTHGLFLVYSLLSVITVTLFPVMFIGANKNQSQAIAHTPGLPARSQARFWPRFSSTAGASLRASGDRASTAAARQDELPAR